MNMFDAVWFQWVLLPVLIFTALISDVIIGKGIRKLAVVLAFFEVLIWLVVIHQLLINITNVIHYAACAAGLGIIFLVDKRKNLDHITGIIKQYNPNAVYTVEDVRYRKNRKGK